MAIRDVAPGDNQLKNAIFISYQNRDGSGDGWYGRRSGSRGSYKI